jgi:hypothetical protein
MLSDMLPVASTALPEKSTPSNVRQPDLLTQGNADAGLMQTVEKFPAEPFPEYEEPRASRKKLFAWVAVLARVRKRRYSSSQTSSLVALTLRFRLQGL